MTPAQVADVQQSFAQLRPQADTVAAQFYQRLFTLDPSVRRLFPDDLTAQGRKLMDMLGLVVHGLPRVDTILPAVQALGRQHVSYGVRPEHYQTVGRRSSGPWSRNSGRPGPRRCGRPGRRRIPSSQSS
jgi:hemoglobin-like flavoprotein